MREKVAFFIPSLRGGGAERVILNLAKGLVEEDIQLDLVLAKAEGAYLSQVPKEINIVDLKSKHVLYALPALVRYLQREKPYVLLSAMNHTNVVAVLAGLINRKRTKIVLSEHSTLSSWVTYSSNFKDKILPIFMRVFYRFADEIVAVSKGVAEDLSEKIKLSRKRVKVIYNPVIDEKMLDSSKKEIKNSNIKGEKFILSVGRLTEAKDYPTLIRAFDLIKSKFSGKLIILGEGEKRDELTNLVNELNLREDVLLPGFVENPYAYMRKADLLVLSSKWEGLPTVLVEALAVGTKVISTNCPSGPNEILKNGKLGKLVPVGDENSLAQEILITLQNEVTINVQEDLKDFYLDNALELYKSILLK